MFAASILSVNHRPVSSPVINSSAMRESLRNLLRLAHFVCSYRLLIVDRPRVLPDDFLGHECRRWTFFKPKQRSDAAPPLRLRICVCIYTYVHMCAYIYTHISLSLIIPLSNPITCRKLYLIRRVTIKSRTVPFVIVLNGGVIFLASFWSPPRTRCGRTRKQADVMTVALTWTRQQRNKCAHI